MKFYAIPPNKHLDMMDNGDNYFCLAHHYIKDTVYQNHFLTIRKNNPDAFILLDNGAAEHSLVTEQILVDIVKELKPNEVISPDVLFDKKQTLDNFYSFLLRMEHNKLLEHTSVFACPQGQNKEEWLQCYYTMMTCPNVSCVGLSKIAVPKCWNQVTGDKLIGKSRNECVQELQKMNFLRKPLHLLGMGEHTEFDFYLKNKIPNIRSSDSCYTILAAINGISFEEGDTTRIPTENAYFDVELNEAQKTLAKKNINYLKTKYKNI
jgi:hypothetical protein